MVVLSSPLIKINRLPYSSFCHVIAPNSTHLLPAGAVCSVVRTPPFCFVLAVPTRLNAESVWETTFRKFRSEILPHDWRLMQVTSKPNDGRNWKTFVDSAKVRFYCEACGHGWTSMKGRITFWCCFLKGVVAFRVYGQQCQKCQGQRYEIPIWYPEEISKVLLNMTHRIANLFYGSSRPTICLKRRPGKPKTSHNSEKCQACEDGVCALRR